MRKLLTTIGLITFITAVTASFGFAEYVAAGIEEFPYFHLGALIIGGLTIVSLRNKFEEMHMSEAMGAFALYTVLVSVFTNPVIEIIKHIVE